MGEMVSVGQLSVDNVLVELVEELAGPAGIAPETFWGGLEQIAATLGERNRALLRHRDMLQQSIDTWCADRQGQPWDVAAYEEFLRSIDYIVPEGEQFAIDTVAVDPEIAEVAGPQLVVPLDNARYALNAANARWGSLYDALYGTDVIAERPGEEVGGSYNPRRGARVVAYTSEFLDASVPLARGSHGDVAEYQVANGGVVAALGDGSTTGLSDARQFAGYRTGSGRVEAILLRNHGLYIEIQIDRDHPIGKDHPAGVKDVLLESAVTTIQDCEDSVASCDAEEKALVYRNWAGLMAGTLTADFVKGDESLHRTLNPDREYLDRAGKPFRLPGRSLMLVRHVGHHIYTDAVLGSDGEPIPETFLDAMVTALAAMPNLRGQTTYPNSRHGNMYVVKPKLHGPAEVQLAVDLLAAVEGALGLERWSLKIGIMDEERRTTLNLKECIRAARDRVIFINTGFLDRTGDEIHTSMEAGAMVPKPEIKSAPWMLAYEDWNVDVGLECGFAGKAQIGKGMWAMPDEMRALVDQKIAHPQAGANCAWVPSPTAATLHAMHYHAIDVAARQRDLEDRPRAPLADLLTPPLLPGARELDSDDIQRELENNAQGILGYVVRWVEQGIGCSKVPDINDVGLMEDRATLRISSQHIANWLRHGIVTREEVEATMRRMAVVVDRQNEGDTAYRPMGPDFEASYAFRAALELVFHGREEPNGYTEPVLNRIRREFKAAG